MTTASAPRARRRAALLAAAALSTLALSSCALNSPAQTLGRYAPADGVEADGETLDVRDLLVVSHGAGAPGVVSGSLINQSDEELTVTINVGGEDVGEVTVEPGKALRLAGDDDLLTVPALEAAAGQSVAVRISAGGETLTANAPILLPHGPFEQFADDAGGTVAPHPEQEGSGDH